jgi:hypothetical protein
LFVRNGHKGAPKQALGSRLKHFDMLRGRWVLPMFELGRDQIGGRGTAAAGDRGEHFLRGCDAFTTLPGSSGKSPGEYRQCYCR